jgi:hypothetical protein
VRSGPGSARTILLFHIISARPSKQSRMVRTFLQIHTRPRLKVWNQYQNIAIISGITNMMKVGYRG